MNTPENIAAALRSTFSLALPELILVGAACVLFLGGTFRTGRNLWAGVAFGSILIAGYFLNRMDLAVVNAPDYLRTLTLDRLAFVTKVISLVGGAILILLCWHEVDDRHAADFYACLLVMIAGVSLTGTANDLIVLFLALELISIPTYVLLYLQRLDTPAKEAAAKYFLLSIFSSGLLLFGFSYLYGLTGSTNLSAMLDALTRSEPNRMPFIALAALIMVASGLGFKITAWPFHFYAPDVYQGTTFSAAAILAFVPKVAGFVGLIRVPGYVWAAGTPGLALGPKTPIILFWLLAALTMSVGNVLALLQDNLKRILAYSSVAHAGYMLIGLAVAPGLTRQPIGGVECVLFYLVAYGSMTIGAFAVLSYLSTPERPLETVDDLAGLSRSHPGIALIMALFLFSLIGVPMTAGFAGKLFLFMSAMTAATTPGSEDYARVFRGLALIGALNAAAGGWYYLRMIAAMYLRTPLRMATATRAWPSLATIWICGAMTLGFGVYPQPLLEAMRSVSTSVIAGTKPALAEIKQEAEPLPAQPR